MTVHVTISIEEAVKADLDGWAEARGVPLDALLAEAIESYAIETREIIEVVERSRAAVAAGDVFEHEDVVAEFAARRAEWMSRA